jgi:tetratricopeptide (TPR) repeat protein
MTFNKNFLDLKVLGISEFEKNNYPSGIQFLNAAHEINPADKEVIEFLVASLLELNLYKEALDKITILITLDKSNPITFYNQGNAFFGLQSFNSAIESFTKSIQLGLNHPDVYSNRGLSYFYLKDMDKAILDYEKSKELNPLDFEIIFNLGQCFYQKNDLKNAIKNFNECISSNPNDLASRNARGLTYIDMFEYEAALSDFEKCIELNSSYIKAYTNLSILLRLMKQNERSECIANKGLKLDPENNELKFNLSLIKLSEGKYNEGLALYESRLNFTKIKNKKFTYGSKLWNGQSLKDKTIYVYSEQGLGDTIQFSRFIFELNKRGATVFFKVQDELFSLMSQFESEQLKVLKADYLGFYNYHISLMSLPLQLNIDIYSLPEFNSYIHADDQKKQYWKEIIIPNKKIKIGLVWAGGLRNDRDVWYTNLKRNIDLKFLEPLGNLTNCEFYSLQKGNQARSELALLINANWRGPNIIDYTDNLSDFSDTAAFIDNLDLILSVDTSVAHLSAALGKTTWILNRYETCWRWLDDNRTGSPWYKSVRLFRQSKPYNWKDVINEVFTELTKLTSSNS